MHGSCMGLGIDSGMCPFMGPTHLLMSAVRHKQLLPCTLHQHCNWHRHSLQVRNVCPGENDQMVGACNQEMCECASTSELGNFTASTGVALPPCVHSDWVIGCTGDLPLLVDLVLKTTLRALLAGSLGHAFHLFGWLWANHCVFLDAFCPVSTQFQPCCQQ